MNLREPDASAGSESHPDESGSGVMRMGDHGLLERLLDNAVEPILTISREGAVLTASRAALRLLGYRRADVVGKHARMLMPEEHRGRFEEYLARFLARSSPIAAEGPREVEAMHRDGFRLLVDLTVVECVHRRKTVYVVMLRDASERRAMQEELRRERDFAESVIDTAPTLVRVLDLQGRIIRGNQRFTELTGCAPEGYVGRPWTEAFVAPEERPEFEAHLREVVADKKQGLSKVSSLLTRDGRTRKIQWQSCLLRESGEPIGILSIGLDVTEAQRAEDLLARAQKMEAIGRLTGGIAHDFNNLLMGILGCCKQAMDRIGEGHAAMPFLTEITQSTQRNVKLTRRLLTFSRLEPTARTVVDVVNCVRSVASFARQLIGADITLATRFTCANALVEGDPTHVEQVLMNLVVNARDAMPAGGEMSIRVSEDTAPAPLAAAGQVVLEVEDTGCGMTAEVQKRIFEPFFTTKPQGQGTGLGLATVFGIVSRMHGQIAVDSAPGLGTRFRITLPRTDKQGAVPTPIPTVDQGQAPAQRGNGQTVLLVEDESIVRLSLQSELQQLGYKTVVAADAAQALAAVGNGARFDVLLTDVVLPGAGGPELARAVRMTKPDARVVFMSAHAHEHLVQQGKLEPGDFSLEKPFSREALAQKLHQALAKDGQQQA